MAGDTWHVTHERWQVTNVWLAATLAGSYVWLVSAFGLHWHLAGSCFMLAADFGWYSLFLVGNFDSHFGLVFYWLAFILDWQPILADSWFWQAIFFSSYWQPLLVSIYIWLSDTLGWKPFWSSRSRSVQAPGSVFQPQDKSGKIYCDFLGPFWFNIKVDPEI